MAILFMFNCYVRVEELLDLSVEDILLTCENNAQHLALLLLGKTKRGGHQSVIVRWPRGLSDDDSMQHSVLQLEMSN